jgi:hypothetical protein
VTIDGLLLAELLFLWCWLGVAVFAMAPSVYRLFHLGDWWLTEPRFLRLYDRFRHEVEAKEPGWEEPPALWEVVLRSVTEIVLCLVIGLTPLVWYVVGPA